MFFMRREDDGGRRVQAGFDEGPVHGRLVPGMACLFMGIDTINGVIAGPLDGRDKARVGVSSPVEKGPKGYLVVQKGLQHLCEVVRGDLQQ